MSELANEPCEPCRADSPALELEAALALAAQLPGWSIRIEEGIPVLVRLFRFPDFGAALEFAAALGPVADAADHHPRVVVEWGRVEVSWWTHAIGGLHRNDFIMAAQTDRLAAPR